MTYLYYILYWKLHSPGPGDLPRGDEAIAERPVPDSEPVPVQRGDGAFISSGFSPECISLCVVVSESKAHKNA